MQTKAGCAFAYIPGELTKPRCAHQKSRSPNEPPPVGLSSKLKTGLNFFFGAGDGTRTRACELGKLVPYHLATPAYIRFALHAKPCGHYSLKHAPASEQNENVRESSTHRAQEASWMRSAETRGRSKSLVRRRAGSAAWYQALMQVLPQGKGGRWPSRSLFCSAGVGRCPPSLQILFS